MPRVKNQNALGVAVAGMIIATEASRTCQEPPETTGLPADTGAGAGAGEDASGDWSLSLSLSPDRACEVGAPAVDGTADAEVDARA
ncbi:MAG: hypothetical protein M3Y09_15390 [Actinomycetota bacterium]|nr:hypothetical protein [Actinomycetota bacterium]